jgi:2-polyprenyl-6-methoxyphenol hydroxylase-like FAD-dependent oxidoreductase
MAAAGATDRFVAEGVRVRRGHAFSGRVPLGTLDFAGVPGPYSFVLTLPQHRTEAILAECLGTWAPDALRRGMEVTNVTSSGGLVDVRGTHHGPDGSADPFRLAARIAVGCDGRESVVRRSAGIAVERTRYPDTYVMGDVHDDTGLGHDAAIHLTERGVVESFPLPRGRRRWVVKTAERTDEPTVDSLAALVEARTGVAIDPAECTMLSSFGVERVRPSAMVRGRVVLAGDSGHVVPPIGGQGMNLGWLDAVNLAAQLPGLVSAGGVESGLAGYERRRRAAWREGARRADLNLRLGRATRWGWARDAVVKAMLSPWIAGRTARMFAMHGAR